MARHGMHGLMTTAADIKARCTVDPATHCWIWQGAVNARSKTPVLYAFDHARADKRAMSGALAAWNIAHAAAPLPGPECVVRLAMGVSHLCYLSPGADPRCLGDNSRGQLGDLTRVSRSAPVNVRMP